MIYIYSKYNKLNTTMAQRLDRSHRFCAYRWKRNTDGRFVFAAYQTNAGVTLLPSLCDIYVWKFCAVSPPRGCRWQDRMAGSTPSSKEGARQPEVCSYWQTSVPKSVRCTPTGDGVFCIRSWCQSFAGVYFAIVAHFVMVPHLFIIARAGKIRKDMI